jgi:hypothetical protein
LVRGDQLNDIVEVIEEAMKFALLENMSFSARRCLRETIADHQSAKIPNLIPSLSAE